MAFSFQLGSSNTDLANIADVRLLITDTEASTAICSDEMIRGFLRIEGGSIKKAAAQALDHIASRETLVLKRQKTLGLELDGPAGAKDLRVHAASLRAQAEQESTEPEAGAIADVAFVDLCADPFAWRY